jgi:hypothetical protein
MSGGTSHASIRGCRVRAAVLRGRRVNDGGHGGLRGSSSFGAQPRASTRGLAWRRPAPKPKPCDASACVRGRALHAYV